MTADTRVRQAAVRALGQLGPGVAEQTLPFLIECLGDESGNVRVAALETLQSLSWSGAADLITDAIAMLRGSQYAGIFVAFAQRRELELFYELGAAAVPFTARVIELLDEPPQHWSVRLGAIEVLGKIRRVPDQAVRELLRIRKKDPFQRVRDAADDALEAILSLDPDIPEDVGK